LDYYVRRVIAAVCSLSAASIMLIVRLYFLSSDTGGALEVLSGQYTRKNTFAERNGFVYDTNGSLLSHEEYGAIAAVNPAADTDKSRIIGFLTDNSSNDFDELVEIFSQREPFTVKLDRVPDSIPPDGVYVYPNYLKRDDGICRHILGYRNADGEGMSGIYKSFDSYLDSVSGSLSYKYTANALGGVMDEDSFYIEDTGYVSREGLVLTIDSALQQKVDKICDEGMDMGAVIVCELSSGNILALSSRPLYDGENAGEYLNSDRGEFINRAFSLYTPGSVFKAVVAAAALEKDEKLYMLEYECTGECDVSGKTFKCHNKEGHGVQTMKEAFANSCNTYFIKLLDKTGFEYVLAVCSRMGLGEASIIDGFYVKPANMPVPGKSYPDAYKANFAFGQGELLLSAVDVMRLYSICSTGEQRDLSLVKGFYGASKEQDVFFDAKPSKKILSDNTVDKMRQMMYNCVIDGTGKAAAVKGINVGGKTATAQSGQMKDDKEVLHKWFAGAFPIENPKYAVVVLCDGNGKNGKDPKEIFALCAESIAEIYDN